MDLRSIVSFADLVRAAQHLSVTDTDRLAQIAVMLGLAEKPVITDGPMRGSEPLAPPPTLPTDSRRAPTDQSTLVPLVMKPPLHGPSHGETSAPEPALVDSLEPEAGAGRPPRCTPPLDALLDSPSKRDELPDTSLFVSRWRRGIVSALVSSRRPVGDVDIPLVVDRIANGRPVQELPRRRVYTMRAGLQLLVDIGEGMRPFDDDVAELLRLLSVTVGEALQPLRFDGTLAGGVGAGTRRTWQPHQTPAAGTPILVLSDFGLSGVGGSMNRSETWQSLATAAAVARCPLLALTPFPSARWPAWLVDAFSVLHWDRPTNAAVARQVAAAAARKRR